MSKKILIAEDDLFFQKFYSTELKEHGFEVEVAADGEEALSKLDSYKPDLLLLDIIMPKKDGFEVLKTLSTESKHKRLPIIIFSTLGQESDMQKAKQLGAHDYINKSFFDLEILISKIEALMQKNS
jgi:DNA-binding response OmpR family regulator